MSRSESAQRLPDLEPGAGDGEVALELDHRLAEHRDVGRHPQPVLAHDPRQVLDGGRDVEVLEPAAPCVSSQSDEVDPERVEVEVGRRGHDVEQAVDNVQDRRPRPRG